MFACLLPVISCRSSAKVFVGRGVYCWKTVIDLGARDIKTFDRIGITKIYLRVADVIYSEKNKRPEPAATMIIGNPLPDGFKIVPVVFITPDVFRNIDDKATKRLATDISSMIRDFSAATGKKITEAQVDFDWTPSTRQRYFYFLGRLEELAVKLPGSPLISCTIRLHQVRYRDKTGIPPVKHAALMAYNTGSGGTYSRENTIFDLNELRKYISNGKGYGIKMDLIMPVFSQTEIYSNNRLRAIVKINDTLELDRNSFLGKIRASTYVVRKNMVFHGADLHAGEIIRTESAVPGEVKQAVMDMKNKLELGGTISVFDYDDGEGFDDEKIAFINSVFDN